MRIPRVACINDLSGFGRCSLTTAIAVLSAAGVQACPVPTAVLSKHTGFEKFYFKDLTESLQPYLDDWKNIEFDGIYSGFLGSAEQIEAVCNFIISRRTAENTPVVIIDPVMGDRGRLYSTFTEQMQRGMRSLAAYADILTPNITEACFLTDTPYTGEEISVDTAEQLVRKTYSINGAQVVLTGIIQSDKIINMTFDGRDISLSEVKHETKVFSGTGDIFASVVCAFTAGGRPLHEAVDIAGKFISAAIKRTVSSGTPLSEGVIFEPVLCELGRL